MPNVLSPTSANVAPQCPWSSSSSSSSTQTKSPIFQDIVDEELARKLHEDELKDIARCGAAPSTDGIYAHLQTKPPRPSSTDDDDRNDNVNDEADGADDDSDEVDERYWAKNHRVRTRERRRADNATPKLRVSCVFDDRTMLVLNKLAGRDKLTAVTKRLHSSSRALLHLATATVRVRDDGDGNDDARNAPAAVDTDDSGRVVVHYVAKILKTPSDEQPPMPATASVSGRPLNSEMLWMSIRRQLKTRLDREYHALARAAASGVRVPAPICAFEHVMLMTLVGDDGQPAPTLHHVSLSPGQLAQTYVELLTAVRKLYQDAHLVHGALSEFTVLFHRGGCWLVDFSQAVDTAHSEHREALARDLEAVHDFYARRRLAAATKHRVGLLPLEAMTELVTAPAPARGLHAWPCLKPFFYHKKAAAAADEKAQ